MVLFDYIGVIVNVAYDFEQRIFHCVVSRYIPRSAVIVEEETTSTFTKNYLAHSALAL